MIGYKPQILPIQRQLDTLQQYLIANMLDKYQSFYKLSKGPHCAIYTAFNRLTAQNVLLKRISNRLGPTQWNQILTHKELALAAKTKAFPKLNQIFRHKGSFYYVFEKPYGHSLAPHSLVEKQTLHSTIQLMSDLLEGLKELIEAVPALVVFPEWVFFHRNSLRVIHYEPFLNVEEQQKHIITHQQAGEDDQSTHQTDFMPVEYRNNTVFHLGMMVYRLLSGKKEENISSHEQYSKYVAVMRQNCERQIFKNTNDPKMASFVAKMISDNRFEVPSLQQTINFFTSLGRQLRHPGGQHKDLTLQVEIQKFNITTARVEVEDPRRIRQCCLKQEPPKSITNADLIKMGLSSQKQMRTAKKSKLILPYLSIKNSCSLPRRHNVTSINRHQPLLAPSKFTQRNHSKSIGHVYTQPF